MARASTISHPDRELIRARVLQGIGGNRVPGLHFPGHFLGIEWRTIGADSATVALPCGPHCTEADGGVNLSALAVLVDAALGTASRLKIEAGARQATVHLHLLFTGTPARGELVARAQLLGFTHNAAIRQSLLQGTVYAGDRVVCHASGTFVLLPPPPGMTLSPLPWQREEKNAAPPVDEATLSAEEKRVLRQCDKALAAAAARGAFIRHFWGGVPAAASAGHARIRVPVGPHIGNRVGHVQGGILLGLAASTAIAAAPRHVALSSLSAWYVSPGRGKALAVRARVLHAGRSFSVVHTEITGSGGARVIEVVSNHVARPPSPREG